MTVTNYELNYKNLRGRDTTLVSIKLEDKGRYSTHERELAGDRMNESDETLIEAVLDIIRTEMDPAGAIVKVQAKLEQSEQKLEQSEKKIAESETKQNEQGEIMNLINKVIRVIALDSIMGEKISYGTTYKELVALFPLAEIGKTYPPHGLFTIEDPNLTEINGEGKRVLIQVNREFTYNGEPVSDFARNGRLEMDGTGAAWKYEPKE
nr:MAG TPA_asm: Protein of unknown function (DUF1366) [Caudoviricetes sp.]